MQIPDDQRQPLPSDAQFAEADKPWWTPTPEEQARYEADVQEIVHYR